MDKKIKTIAEACSALKACKLPYGKVAVTDMDGILRGKYMSKKKLLSALKDGFGFCDVILGWDSNDQIYDDIKYTGWSSGFPDAHVMPIPETGGLFLLKTTYCFF